jgi:ketosteroid isomerase-like protein
MGLAENKQLIRAFYDAANRGAIDECLGYLADDVLWTNVGSTRYSGSFRGKSTLVADLLQPVFGQLKAGIASTVDNVIAEGDYVAVQSRGTAETTDGKPYNNTYCHVFRVVNGQIAEVTEYLDTQLTASTLRT